ncbi:MAG: hypothetical protein UU74_C0033G0028, partial [Candidatus Woesebacteria bacterium GW2011_GWA1_41_7]
ALSVNLPDSYHEPIEFDSGSGNIHLNYGGEFFPRKPLALETSIAVADYHNISVCPWKFCQNSVTGGGSSPAI